MVWFLGLGVSYGVINVIKVTMGRKFHVLVDNSYDNPHN